MFWLRRLPIALVLLLFGVAPGAAQTTPAAANGNTVETGALNGAPFYIEIPKAWNKGLVLYAHGYTVVGAQPPPMTVPRMRALADEFLSRGFAFAASAYSRQGWAVKEGIEDTEALRRYFVSKYGAATESYITGHSMGGHITMATIERYPESYQGAMPMCGPLGAAIDFLNTGVFDMLVTFEAMFPGTIGSPYEPTAETPSKIKAALAADPARAARYAQRFGRTPAQVAGALPLYHLIAAELKQRVGGEPFDNRNRIYAGFGDDAALNRTVKRYAAQPAAREYIPTVRDTDRTHHRSDPDDPDDIRRAGAWQRCDGIRSAGGPCGDVGSIRCQIRRGRGHCNFTSTQTGNAFDALRAWARDGKRPEAGEQK